MPVPQEIVDYANFLARTPFESFSRFLYSPPKLIHPADLDEHLAAGWGLNCKERSWAMSRFLTSRGYRNELVAGGFEVWFQGMRVSKSAAQPLDEALAKRFYAPDWKTSIYEKPFQLVHWATLCHLDEGPVLIDIMGNLPDGRILGPEATRQLLHASPKHYLDYSPARSRLYYHTLSSELVQLIHDKEESSLEYRVGTILSSIMLTGTHSQLTVTWFWSDEAKAQALATAPTSQRRLTGGEQELFYVDELSEARPLMPDLTDERVWRAFEEILPAIRMQVREVFDAPKHVMLMIVRAKRPLAAYCADEVPKLAAAAAT